MKADAILVARILGDLITEDDFGRITDTCQKLGANGMVKFLASPSDEKSEEQVRNILYGMHKRHLIDLTLDSDGELGTICIHREGINLYRQLEVI